MNQFGKKPSGEWRWEELWFYPLTPTHTLYAVLLFGGSTRISNSFYSHLVKVECERISRLESMIQITFLGLFFPSSLPLCKSLFRRLFPSLKWNLWRNFLGATNKNWKVSREQLPCAMVIRPQDDDEEEEETRAGNSWRRPSLTWEAEEVKCTHEKKRMNSIVHNSNDDFHLWWRGNRRKERGRSGC